jgi:hypothetical protein
MHIKINLIIILILGITLSTPEVLHSQELAGKIKMSIRVDKNSFVEGESIWPELVIENISGQDVTLPNPAKYKDIHCVVKNSQGKTIPDLLFGFKEEYLVDTVHLFSKGFLYQTLNMRGYGSYENFKWAPPGCTLIADNYTLYVAIGYVWSDTLEFQVTKATVEQQDLAIKINHLYNPYPGKNIETAKALLRQYPNSIYLPEIYQAYLQNLRISGDTQNRSEGMMIVVKEFLDKYPNSGIGYIFIREYIKGFKNKLGIERLDELSIKQKQQLETVFRELKKKFPDKRIAREIDNKLSEQRKKDPNR